MRIPEKNGHRDDPRDSSRARLIELMTEYHASLADGKPFAAAAETATLDEESRAAFARAKRVLERLARVRPQFAASCSGAVATDRQPIPAPLNGLATSSSDLPKTFGRFQIVSELGHGGLGVVLLARDPVLGRSVALKIPRPDALFTRNLRQRFSREAQAAARLTHPNLVPVYEVGEVGPICYIASAYCEGPNLATWLRTDGQQISSRQAASIVAALADAMHYAHSQGVLHRDLKPSNILIEPSAASAASDELASMPLSFTPKITDFGLAKVSDISGTKREPAPCWALPLIWPPNRQRAAPRKSTVAPTCTAWARSSTNC